MDKSIRRSLIFYLLFVILSVICQFPLIILTSKIFLSGLIDNLLIIYLIFLLLFVLISISLFTFLCLSPSTWCHFNSLTDLKQDDRSIISETSHKFGFDFLIQINFFFLFCSDQM
jgi:hypothetical protein